MNENLENNDWKTDAPRLAAMDKKNPFAVPDGYFENVNGNIATAIFLDKLKQETNDQYFEVPQNYFGDLTERIETNISLSELPKAGNTFAVPANYFETLQDRITERISTSEPKKAAKIVPLWRRSIVKYASAACFILMASFGAYFYQNSASSTSAQTAADLANEQLLYDIDESTIIEHLEAQNTTASKTTSASDTEMENYILSNFSSSDLTQALNN